MKIDKTQKVIWFSDDEVRQASSAALTETSIAIKGVVQPFLFAVAPEDRIGYKKRTIGLTVDTWTQVLHGRRVDGVSLINMDSAALKPPSADYTLIIDDRTSLENCIVE